MSDALREANRIRLAEFEASLERNLNLPSRDHLQDAAPWLYRALKTILEHVEDLELDRHPNGQCTLCYTYRNLGHFALRRAEGQAL